VSQTNFDNPELPILIVNPNSAGGATGRMWSSIAADFRAHFGPFVTAFTQSSGDGVHLARDAARAGHRFIIACGGDGTINEVVNGIMESGADVELGVLPSGTGGDFRRFIGMSNETRDAAKQLRTGNTKPIDIGRVEYIDKSGEKASRFFINISSFGIGASVATRVANSDFLKWLPLSGAARGRARFAVSTLEEALNLQTFDVKMSIDGGPPQLLRTIALCVCNSSHFGGGMNIAPDARNDDGLLDIVGIGDIGLRRIIGAAPRLYGSGILKVEGVTSGRATRLHAESADGKTVPLETDGEVVGSLPATYEILPGRLKIRVPSMV
jgi:YegS/Rv2252/BmrU family lipid kinase